MDACLDGATAVGQELTEDELFNLVAPLNFDFKHFDDPNFWFDLPKGSKILIDECQQFFPPRSVGSRVPAAIQKLETHRHGGYDLHFVTQDATLADQNLRKLVGRHVHFFNPFGGKRVTRKESPEVFNPKDYHQNKQATKKTIKHPKEFYGAYYSAEIHTHKLKIPKFLVLLLILPLLIACLIYYVYDSLFASAIAAEPDNVSVVHTVDNNSTHHKSNSNVISVDSVENDDLTDEELIKNQMTEHLENMTEGVFISGSNGVWSDGELVEYQYSFVRISDNNIFDPRMAGLTVDHVGECLALMSIGGVTKSVTCNPFYKREPVTDSRSDDAASMFRARDKNST